MAASSRSAAPLFLLLVALLVAAQCSARDGPAEAMLDPKCQVMTAMCTLDSCTDLCLNIGLGAYQGFCTFHDMQMYCCCPIPADAQPPPPRKTHMS
uniref:Uncharacterized protein n=1 Tax=Avena sativa TaxID=4498 RepID=A0ACD5YQ74_AVESA